VDLVSDPLLLRKSGSAGNRTRASGSVARNSDHQTTVALFKELRRINQSVWAEKWKVLLTRVY
jgi:hypothetical protein